MTARSYTPAQLARLLGAAEPTAEQAAVIGAPLRPMAVIAGAGSGKSETMAARLVWLVANGLIRPERVLGRPPPSWPGGSAAGWTGSAGPGGAAAGRTGAGRAGMNCPGNPLSLLITPMPAGWSAITRCARHWSRRCA